MKITLSRSPTDRLEARAQHHAGSNGSDNGSHAKLLLRGEERPNEDARHDVQIVLVIRRVSFAWVEPYTQLDGSVNDQICHSFAKGMYLEVKKRTSVVLKGAAKVRELLKPTLTMVRAYKWK